MVTNVRPDESVVNVPSNELDIVVLSPVAVLVVLEDVLLDWLIVVWSDVDVELLLSRFSTMPVLELPVPEKIDSLVRVSFDSTRRRLLFVAMVLVEVLPNE